MLTQRTSSSAASQTITEQSDADLKWLAKTGAAVVAAGTIFITWLTRAIQHDIAIQHAHMASHPKIITPEGEEISYSNHPHRRSVGDSYSIASAEVPECVVSKAILVDNKRYGLFKNTANNATIVADNAVQIAMDCFLKKISNGSPIFKGLIAPFSKEIREQTSKLSPNDSKAFAKLLNEAEFAQRHMCGHKKFALGSGSAHYIKPSSGFFRTNAQLIIFPRHKYTVKDYEQIASNFTKILVNAVAKPTVIQKGLTKRGRIRG